MSLTFSAPYIHDTIYTCIRSHSFVAWIFKSSPSSANICFRLPNTSNALRHEFIKVLETFHRDFALRPFDKADQFLQIFLWAVSFFFVLPLSVPARPEGAALSRVQAAGKNTSFCHVSGSILRRRFITATWRRTRRGTKLSVLPTLRDSIVGQQSNQHRFYLRTNAKLWWYHQHMTTKTTICCIKWLFLFKNQAVWCLAWQSSTEN